MSPSLQPIRFESHPSRYRHWSLETEGNIGWLTLQVDEAGGIRPGYSLKLNSYDLGVDIELADAVERLRFEHPEVGAVVIRSGLDRVFSSGANIFMLAGSSHGFKVNFCKFTNETRLAIEDASRGSGQKYLAALAGTTAGAATNSRWPATRSSSRTMAARPFRCRRCPCLGCSREPAG